MSVKARAAVASGKATTRLPTRAACRLLPLRVRSARSVHGAARPASSARSAWSTGETGCRAAPLPRLAAAAVRRVDLARRARAVRPDARRRVLALEGAGRRRCLTRRSASARSRLRPARSPPPSSVGANDCATCSPASDSARLMHRRRTTDAQPAQQVVAIGVPEKPSSDSTWQRTGTSSPNTHRSSRPRELRPASPAALVAGHQHRRALSSGGARRGWCRIAAAGRHAAAARSRSSRPCATSSRESGHAAHHAEVDATTARARRRSGPSARRGPRGGSRRSASRSRPSDCRRTPAAGMRFASSSSRIVQMSSCVRPTANAGTISTPPARGLVHDAREPGHRVRRVRAVAVGRLDEHHVGVLDHLRVAQDGHGLQRPRSPSTPRDRASREIHLHRRRVEDGPGGTVR